MAKRPTAIAKLDGGRLVPVSSWDAELLSGEKQGQEFDLVRRSARSKAHHGMYWAQLGLIVKATEAFATSDHMHTWIKARLGYVAPIMGPKGQVVGMTIDSTAFDKMDQAAFNVYYEKSSRLVLEEMGIDMAQVRLGWSI